LTLEIGSLPLLEEALGVLESGFADLPAFNAAAERDSLRNVLLETAALMKDNYPYQHPLYAGQMLKPPHPAARLAYMLSLWINPNNHALDGGRCSSRMEKEAVSHIAGMFGWETHLGHLSSGGTMANLEALWVSRRLHPGKKIVASAQAHYTHERICGVLGIPFESVQYDKRARMDLGALEDVLRCEDVGTVVLTMGTTATGSVDPLPEVLKLRDRYGFRIHADAAYGGYYTLLDDLETETRAAFDRLPEVDSIVIDPHKHGLQPYGCGCVLFRDPSVGRFYKHDSPYTYFTSNELHLGEISLQCSSPGAGAVALWATHRLLPLVKGGAFADGLAKCRKAALKLYDALREDERFIAPFGPELDIVVWAPRARFASEASKLTEGIFDAAADLNLHLAKANLPASLYHDASAGMEWDQDYLTSLRSCLMKPEHYDWMDQILELLGKATDRAL
jgi:glutamate/tyrosine decarboxylase-like PLP-dependent enzyme